VSTADVYGLSPPPGTDEKTPLHLRHASAAVNAHVAADREFSAGCREFGLDGTILRPGLTYGARSSWFAGVIAEVQRGEVRLAGRGEGICNCVFLDRVVMAVRLALKPKTAPGPAFIITDDEPVTWREFYEALAREIEIPSMIHCLAAGGELPPETVQRHRCAWKLPTQRANQVLGLKPVVPFAEGLSRSVAWWRFAQGQVAA
jgi:nucleoside-diphosphate-sugar epimerase